jgi:hypothetical protein
VTAQTPEILEIDYAQFQLGDWRMYGAIRGEPTEENHGWGQRAANGYVKVYRADPGAAKAQISCNWKGYKEVYRLHGHRRLTLLRFDYDFGQRPPYVVNESIEGEFYLVFKMDFFGPRLYVPFRDGSLLLDHEEWRHEVGPLLARQFRQGCHPDFPNRIHRGGIRSRLRSATWRLDR